MLCLERTQPQLPTGRQIAGNERGSSGRQALSLPKLSLLELDAETRLEDEQPDDFGRFGQI